jgi:hypothetical protein
MHCRVTWRNGQAMADRALILHFSTDRNSNPPSQKSLTQNIPAASAKQTWLLASRLSLVSKGCLRMTARLRSDAHKGFAMKIESPRLHGTRSAGRAVSSRRYEDGDLACPDLACPDLACPRSGLFDPFVIERRLLRLDCDRPRASLSSARSYSLDCWGSPGRCIERANRMLRTSKLGVNATIIPRRNQ